MHVQEREEACNEITCVFFESGARMMKHKNTVPPHALDADLPRAYGPRGWAPPTARPRPVSAQTRRSCAVLPPAQAITVPIFSRSILLHGSRRDLAHIGRGAWAEVIANGPLVGGRFAQNDRRANPC